jgi:hypothetical protein
MDLVIGLVLVAAGTFTVVGGAAGWEWFMNHPRVAFMAWLFGRTGARVFYIVLGLAVIALGGYYLVAWVIGDSR